LVAKIHLRFNLRCKVRAGRGDIIDPAVLQEPGKPRDAEWQTRRMEKQGNLKNHRRRAGGEKRRGNPKLLAKSEAGGSNARGNLGVR